MFERDDLILVEPFVYGLDSEDILRMAILFEEMQGMVNRSGIEITDGMVNAALWLAVRKEEDEATNPM
jgi:hypothetical protein